LVDANLLEEALEDAYQVAKADVLVYHEAFDLVELG